jgi:hypothetical protein
MRLPALALWAALLAGCSAVAPPADPFSDIAPAYVQLVLGVGEHEDGYVDAYTGPAAWQDQAKARKRPLAELEADADRLIAATVAVDASRLDALSRKRRAFLEAHLRATRARLSMLGGTKIPFRAEAKAFFAVDLELRPLSSYEAELARIDALVPGTGPLADRMDAFRSRYVIPPARLEPVLRAAIDECRRRTRERIALPDREAFTLEFVKDKTWGGYNWYLGDAKSRIQVNTDLPFYIHQAVDLGCHEGYPGHHVHGILLEEALLKRRGFVEFSIQPLYSPLALIAEGASNYGIELAFPGAEKAAFEARVLYPLAGLDPAHAAAYREVREAERRLQGVDVTIAADYLDGRIDRAAAVTLLQRYRLLSRARAEKNVAGMDAIRSYIVNYGLGEAMVRAHVERAGSPEARWRRMEAILSEPTLPADLLR